MKTAYSAIVCVSIGIAFAGCAGTRVVDSEVRSATTGSLVQAPATYRFERLPSQQSYGEGQAQLEKVVKQALAQNGMTLLGEREGPPRYTVQIGMRTQREPRGPWVDETPPAPGSQRDFTVDGKGQLVMTQPMPRAELPWIQREVSLRIRDAASSQVVFESSALHSGYWADGAAVLPALFTAALSGFPNPPAGPRKVVVTVQ